MSLAEAQAAHAAAKTAHEQRITAAELAAEALELADPDDEDAFDSAAAAALRTRRAAERAAALVEACAGDVVLAERESQRRELAGHIEAAPIPALFESVKPWIDQLAHVDAALGPAWSTNLDRLVNGAIEAHVLGREIGSWFEARRAIRAAVLEQHGQVDRAVELSAALGETIPRGLVHVQEANVLALAGIERLALAPELDLVALCSIRFVDRRGALNDLDHPRSSSRWRPTWSSADWLRIARRASLLASWRDAMAEEPLTEAEARERQLIANAPATGLEARPSHGSSYDARRGWRPRQEPTS